MKVNLVSLMSENLISSQSTNYTHTHTHTARIMFYQD